MCKTTTSTYKTTSRVGLIGNIRFKESTAISHLEGSTHLWTTSDDTSLMAKHDDSYVQLGMMLMITSQISGVTWEIMKMPAANNTGLLFRHRQTRKK